MMSNILHGNAYLLTNNQGIIWYYGLAGTVSGNKMDNEIRTTFWYFGIIFSVFIAASRLIPDFHKFLGSNSGISQTEIYILLFFSGLILYTNLKINKQNKKEEKDIEEIYKRITAEYNKEIEEKMELIKLMISNTNEKINRIEKNIMAINENVVKIASSMKN